MQVAFWFLQSKRDAGDITNDDWVVIETCDDPELLKETEKAKQFRFTTELGECSIWIPKKALLDANYKRARVKLPSWLTDSKKLPREELKGQIIEETSKAIYFRYRLDLAVWLPKSQIEIEEIK